MDTFWPHVGEKVLDENVSADGDCYFYTHLCYRNEECFCWYSCTTVPLAHDCCHVTLLGYTQI